MAGKKMFSALQLGGAAGVVRHQLSHRVVHAPLTRIRANIREAPDDSTVEYYSQRATNGGLMIGEACWISTQARGYVGCPGILTAEQIRNWRKVNDAVHAKGSVIFAQLWHTGRISRPCFQFGGLPAVSASPIISPGSAFDENWERVSFSVPRPLKTEEVQDVVEDYRIAAINAMEAGFDGVEIHAANGYLIHQFLHDGTNIRTDRYGGSIENRSRFALEITDACTSAVGSENVGIRVIPWGEEFMQPDSDPSSLYTYLLSELNQRNIAYLHMIEPAKYFIDEEHEISGRVAPPDAPDLSCKYFRDIFEGPVIANGGFGKTTGKQIVEDGHCDMVSYGRWFISNPDLVFRIENDLPLTPFDRKFYYGGTDKGYLDYQNHPENNPHSATSKKAKQVQAMNN